MATYAIIGTGGVALHMGTALARLGGTARVVFASRDPTSAKCTELVTQVGAKAAALTHADACHAAQVLILATPGGAATVDVLSTLWKAALVTPQHIVVDLTNPFSIDHPKSTSGGEMLQALSPTIRVVKAFNTVGSNKFVAPTVGTDKIDMFVAGDNAEARHAIMRLADDMGFHAVDAGGIASSRWMEALCYGWVHMAHAMGLGRDLGWKLLGSK